MKRQIFLLILIFYFNHSFSQSFQISGPELKFDGSQLSITYDLSANKQKDVFYIWVEIKDKNGNRISTSSLQGELGERIKPGAEKSIVWIPARDTVILDEEISIELFGERYERSYNKASALLVSSIIPGFGLSKIKNGKKWWLASIPAYGALAGGLLYRFNYLNTYEDYKVQITGPVREDLFSKAQRQSDISTTCFIAALSIWAADLIWVAASPNRYKPLQQGNISISYIPYFEYRKNLISFKIDF